MRRLHRWMSAIALSVTLPTAASAFDFNIPDLPGPIFATPSLEDCQDPNFVNEVHPIVSNQCMQVLGEAAAEEVYQARLESRLSTTYTPAIVDGSPMATALRGTTIRDRARGGIGGGFVLPEWFAYEFDGAEIGSCDEYVYQRFYHYNKYMQKVENADNSREAFDAAFDEDGTGNIGHRYNTNGYGVMSLSNRYNSADQVDDPLMPVHGHLVPDLGVYVWDMPKNDFFALTDSEITMVRRYAPDIADMLDDGQHYYRVRLNGRRSAYRYGQHPTPWELHLQLAEALDGERDAELEVIAARRSTMQRLLKERRTLMRSGASQYNWDVRAVDRQIVDALRQADLDGCLDIDSSLDRQNGEYDYNRCDWAPSDLPTQVQRVMEPKLKFARQLCETHYPPAEAEHGYTYRTLYGSRIESGQNPFADSFYMRRYLEKMRDQTRYYLGQFDADTRNSNGEPNVPNWNRAYGERWVWGDEDIAAAEFGYHAEWGLSDGAVRNTCDVNPQFDVGGNITGHIFGKEKDVVRALAAFDLRRNRRELDFELFGRDYLNYNWERSGNVNPSFAGTSLNEDIHWDTVRSYEKCKTFVIAAVPISVCGELSGRVGFDFDLSAYAGERIQGTNACEPNATASITARPFATVDAIGSGGVGVSGLSGGVYVSVNLLDMSLPAELNASVNAPHDTTQRLADIEVSVDGSAELELSSLAGEAGGYVEFPRVCIPFTSKCVGGRYNKSFFDWDRALHTTFDLFDFEWNLSIDVWQQICGLPDFDC
ncbi:MAG: hypothetical protein ACE366_04165 [Bradymonadia bacterium]